MRGVADYDVHQQRLCEQTSSWLEAHAATLEQEGVAVHWIDPRDHTGPEREDVA